MGMCRACLSTGKDMIPMDSAFVNNYNLLTNLDIKFSSETPIYTCNSCFDAVKFCTEFREKCIASDLTLMEILFTNSKPKVKSKDDSIYEIKQEVKSEYANDSIIDDYLEDPFNDYDESYIMKTEDDEWSSSKTKKHVKKKVTIRTRHASSKEKIEYGDTLVACGVCSKSFAKTENLVKHLENHKLHNSCGLCTEQFLDYTHLLAHRIVHLPEKQKKCHLCSKRHVSAENLEFHYVEKHNLRGEKGQVLCKQCLTPYTSARKLIKHKWAVHSDIKYSCNECGKGFRIKNALKTHMVMHNEEKAFKCDSCDFKCKYAGGMRVHKLRKHTEGRVYCKTCSRAFASQDILDKHACKQTLTVCPICGIYVNKSSHLSRHIDRNSSEPRYRCDRCPAKFKSVSSYKAHMNKHDGTKPFHCEFCPMSFYSHPVLIKHRRVHTGEKPYVCKICGKAFTGNNNRKVHMKVHGIDLIVKKTAEPCFDIFQ